MDRPFVGLRIAAPAARLLAQILDDAGFGETARRSPEAIAVWVRTGAPYSLLGIPAIGRSHGGAIRRSVEHVWLQRDDLSTEFAVIVDSG